MHQSFREYVNLVRYHEACKMMMTGQYKMLDICMECGFSDYRYFSKTFLSHTGLTPEAYGRQLTEKVGERLPISTISTPGSGSTRRRRACR